MNTVVHHSFVIEDNDETFTGGAAYINLKLENVWKKVCIWIGQNISLKNKMSVLLRGQKIKGISRLTMTL